MVVAVAEILVAIEMIENGKNLKNKPFKIKTVWLINQTVFIFHNSKLRFDLIF